jgi:hypothetical protein
MLRYTVLKSDSSRRIRFAEPMQHIQRNFCGKKSERFTFYVKIFIIARKMFDLLLIRTRALFNLKFIIIFFTP